MLLRTVGSNPITELILLDAGVAPPVRTSGVLGTSWFSDRLEGNAPRMLYPPLDRKNLDCDEPPSDVYQRFALLAILQAMAKSYRTQHDFSTHQALVNVLLSNMPSDLANLGQGGFRVCGCNWDRVFLDGIGGDGEEERTHGMKGSMYIAMQSPWPCYSKTPACGCGTVTIVLFSVFCASF
jgi:hypothetical protein